MNVCVFNYLVQRTVKLLSVLRKDYRYVINNKYIYKCILFVILYYTALQKAPLAQLEECQTLFDRKVWVQISPGHGAVSLSKTFDFQCLVLFNPETIPT